MANTAKNVGKEWAASLLGLRMQVPGFWWHNSWGNYLYPGWIDSVNFVDNGIRFWLYQLDDPDYQDEDNLYPMRYDAVLAYADEDSLSFSSFRLPTHSLTNPSNESASAAATTTDHNYKEYVRTEPENWKLLKDGAPGRTIEPVPYTGDYKDFEVKITAEELADLKDDNDDMQFYKVMQFCLPRFDVDGFNVNAVSVDLWTWQAAQMGNYMIYLMDNKGFKPKFYYPKNVEHPIRILPHHVCQLYGVKIANMLCGNRSI